MTIGRHSYVVALVTLFVVATVGYSVFQFRDFLAGPILIVASPRDGTTLTESLVEVKGVAQQVSHITLNGRKIFVDETGNFREKLLLVYGYNIITLTAEDQFGREAKETLEILYK